MKGLGLLCGVLLLTGVAWAEEEPFFGTPRAAAVLNQPSPFVPTATGVVNTLQPAFSQLYDFRSGEWLTGSSLALYTFTDEEVPIVSVRAGYAIDFKPYLEAQADLPGLTTRYLPTKIKAWFGVGGLDALWRVAGKYGHVGAFLGYDLDKDSPESEGGLMVGVSLGARLTF